MTAIETLKQGWSSVTVRESDSAQLATELVELMLRRDTHFLSFKQTIRPSDVHVAVTLLADFAL